MATVSKHSLEAWIAGTAAGDMDAFTRLYLETSAAVYTYALSFLRNTHDAEDILQDCYINIRTHAGQYKHGTNPVAWIMTIVKNLSLQQLQRKSRTVELIPEVHLNSHAADPDDKLIVEACLHMLTDEERQIVVLHSVAGFKHREIGAFLNLPPATVITKYRRALKKMRSKL